MKFTPAEQILITCSLCGALSVVGMVNEVYPSAVVPALPAPLQMIVYGNSLQPVSLCISHRGLEAWVPFPLKAHRIQKPAYTVLPFMSSDAVALYGA